MPRSQTFHGLMYRDLGHLETKVESSMSQDGLDFWPNNSALDEIFSRISNHHQIDSGQDLSFEGSNIFYCQLEVGFWSVWKKSQISAWSCDPLILGKMGKFIIWQKMPMFRGLNYQIIVYLQKCLTPLTKDFDPDFFDDVMILWKIFVLGAAMSLRS